MSEPFYLLDYDIPSDSGLENPSGILRHRALRFTKSNWIIYKSLFPWNAFNNLAAGGAKWGLFEMAPSANAELLRAAKDTLLTEIRSAKQRLAASLQLLDEKAAKAVNWKDRKKVAKDRECTVKKLRDLVKQLEQACTTYGIDAEQPLKSALDVALATEQAGYTQAALIADLAALAAGTEMEAAASANDVPVGILADFVEERGGDVTAVRQVMADAAPVVAPKLVLSTLVSKNKQWTTRYEADCTKVTVTRFHRNEEQERVVRTVEEARADYKAQLVAGWTKLELA